jgi:hypothetical protein
MCTVSMVVDHYSDKWSELYTPPYYIAPPGKLLGEVAVITKEEFDALKKDVEEMKKLLQRAKKYDEEHNQPDCESEQKLKRLESLCELASIDFEEIKRIIKSETA